MNFSDFLQQELFILFGQTITIGQVVGAAGTVIGMFVLAWLILKKWLTVYFRREKVKTANQGRIRSRIRYIFYLITLIGIIWNLGLDFTVHETRNFTFRITTLLEVVLIWQIASLLDWIISKVLLYNYYISRESETESERQLETTQRPAGRLVQYTIYAFAAILVLKSFDIDFTIFNFERVDFKISSIVYAILIFLLARLIIWILTQLILFNYYKKNEVDRGSRFAVNQLLKYVIYVIAAFMVMESVGVKMTVIWGGAAALLVGVGLGLQQTFNDLFSGIILLFERSVEVGDMVQLEGLVGTVRRIGLRTSLVETNDNIAVIVPNSKLIIDSVINWSHSDDKIRFKIEIGVAYGSDTQLVKELLTKVAKENVYVLKKPSPTIRFTSFGDSSLNFQLLFWSRNFIVIEDIKSDLRFAIDQKFREHNIEIPFPQRDVWIRKEEE